MSEHARGDARADGRAGSLARRLMERWRRVLVRSATVQAPLVELRLPAEGAARVEQQAAEHWLGTQTLAELTAVGLSRDGRELWRAGFLGGGRAAWFAAPGSLPELEAAHLESAWLVAAAEPVDGVVLCEGRGELAGRSPADFDACLTSPYRELSLYSAKRFDYDPLPDRIVTRSEAAGLALRFVPCGGVIDPAAPKAANLHPLGSYFCNRAAGPHRGFSFARSLPRRRARAGGRPSVLVLTSFLATGGAEHTLFETLRVLASELAIAIATLAPHRRELGDRRREFRRLTERLFSLGDLVHPDAMLPMLLSLIDALSVGVIYNANSTTLFYEFAPELRRLRPALRIVDHLYDHRVGYIERYSSALLGIVDLCVAENHPIEAALVERGWPAERVRVILPCGRPAGTFPEGEAAEAARLRARSRLGVQQGDVVFLTAARMHEQKRPLDLVELAARLRDSPDSPAARARFMLVGGGPLEGRVDQAIVERGLSNIRRLPFRDDIPELILGADVGCLVSEYEGLPVFLLECLQAGRPFLGTAVGEMAAVLRESRAGLVIERPGDLASLESAVRRLCDPELRHALGERARAAAPRFAVEACAAAYGAVLRGQG